TDQKNRYCFHHILPCFSVFRLGRCRGRVRFAVLRSAPLNGATSKLFPSVVETATGLAGSTLSNSSTGLSRISANEFPCRTSILIISGDSLYIQCITVQAVIFCPMSFRHSYSFRCAKMPKLK